MRTSKWRCKPHGHTWTNNKKTSSPLCPHCGTNACEKVTVFKPTEKLDNLIILASDVNYHVVRYARIKTIRTTEAANNRSPTADSVRHTAIKQCQQLIKLLQEIE